MSLNPRPFKLSYVDFAPRCAGSGSIICAPDYERFEWVVIQHPTACTQPLSFCSLCLCCHLAFEETFASVSRNAFDNLGNYYIRCLVCLQRMRLWQVPFLNSKTMLLLLVLWQLRYAYFAMKLKMEAYLSPPNLKNYSWQRLNGRLIFANSA